MKKSIIILAFVLYFLMPIKSFAQGEFFFGLTSQGQNAWFMIPQAPVKIINNFLGGGGIGYDYEYISASDSQGKLKIDKGNFFGIKAKDLFNNFGYGITVGYQPKHSFIGLFARGGYKFRQFRMQPNCTFDNLEKYKINSFSAGIGIRLSTMTFEAMEDEEYCPIFEIGTDYNKVFKCKAPFENDKQQFGSGLKSYYAIGLRFALDGYDDWYSLSLTFEMPHYNYFDKDFTTLDGYKPYADVKVKNFTIGLKFQKEF